MAPIIEISNETLNTLNPEVYTLRNNLESTSQNIEDNSGFIYVPSINLYVAKQRTLIGENWFDTQEALHSNNQKMLTIPEFIEFLKYTRENNQDIYKEVTEVRNPWRSEWLDADFKTKGENLIINYHVFDENRKITKKSKVLDKDTLMKDKIPGIDLASWLNNSTEQGLPKKDSKKGSLYYEHPKADNDSVAGFVADGGGAGLCCDGFPSVAYSYLGVRAAKQRE